MATKRKELQELKDELKNAKAREEQFQAELEFSQAEQQVLETEIIALETGIAGVDLPISSYIRQVEVIEQESYGALDADNVKALLHLTKVMLLRIQRLEAIERRKR